MNPIAAYPISNNMSINIYKIEFGIDDRILAGPSLDKAEWYPIEYKSDSAAFKYGHMTVSLNECLRV